jgi:SAM-dependent methyltransferase
MEAKKITPLYGRVLSPETRAFPNFDFSFIKPVRQRAVELLNLKPGDRVLDVGCGPGGSFPFLVQAVGWSGKVVGVEISHEVSFNAKKRIARNGWENVEVIEAAAQEVDLTGTFDGLLMFAAADVYASEDALENILPHVKDDGRVAAFGAKFSRNYLARVFNPFLSLLFKLGSSTTPRPDYEPWRLLAKYVAGLDVKEYFFGLMFLASGSVTKRRSANRG